MRVHLDTDLGGDADDLAALAMLIGDPDLEITGITTCADVSGQRAEFVRHVLKLAGRTEIPVVAGAASFFGGMRHEPGNHGARYFPEFDFAAPIVRDPPGAALNLLGRSIEAGASVVAIGPYTNLAAFEVMRPDQLARVPLTVMGGYLGLPAPGYPQWGPNMDYNVQADRVAARIVFERLNPLIVPLLPCFGVALESGDVPVLEGGGPLAQLVAHQAQAQFADNNFGRLVAENPSLPRGLLNFQWDPVACGAALGWDCVTVEDIELELVEREGELAFEERPGAKVRRVVTAVDVDGFREGWLGRVGRV